MASWREEEGDQEYWSLQAKEGRISSLALRYRSGDRSVLGELYLELEPAIRAFLRARLAPPRFLPTGVEAEDLYQQSFVALAEAVLAWDHEQHANFVPYFLHSFPWRVGRYLRSQTPARRAASVHIHSVPHDLLMEQIGDVTGTDGRDWDERMAWREMVGELPELYGRVVRLHLYRGLPFGEVAEMMGVSRSAAHEAYGRAISMLRSSLAADSPAGSPEGDGPRRVSPHHREVAEESLGRCLEIMYQLVGEGGRLPGRDTLCRMAGLTWREYREIMARLQALGCIAGRRRGSPGSLVCTTLAEAMERVRVRDW